MIRIFPAFSITTLVLGLLVGSAPARALESSELDIDLENLGADPDATGWLRLRLKTNEARFEMRLTGLEPGADYTLFATRDHDCPADPDALARATLHTDASGRVNASFERFPADPALQLAFDPRAHCISVHDGSEHVLAVQFSTAAQSEGATVSEDTQLASWPAAQGGRADLSYDLSASGRRRFGVGVKDVPVGDYDVCVAGTYRETLTTSSTGQGRIDFMSNAPANSKNESAKKVPLTFDPYADEVEIWTASQTEPPAPCDPVTDVGIALAFSGPLLAQIPGINVCAASLEASTQLDGAAGSGEATLGVASHCERTFEVSVAGLVDGDYEVAVGETVQATFSVTGGAGSIVFGSDTAGERHLDFDAVDELIEVRFALTDTVVLSGKITR